MSLKTILKGLFARKSPPRAITGTQWTGTHFTDTYRRMRTPTPNELMAELKNTAFTCATINASICAAFPPRLYVTTTKSQPEPKCLTKAVSKKTETYLRKKTSSPVAGSASIQEVISHPIITLFEKCNPVHNSFDLWELTTLYQEVHGATYWYLAFGPLGIPEEIWILPTQNMYPRREPESANIIDYYEYKTGTKQQKFLPREIIHFRYPDPKDPYNAGLSPLRAAFESVTVLSDYLAFRQAKFENRAIPDAIISPDEIIGEEERDRLESEWNHKFRRGGAGKVVVGESGLKVQLLNQSLGDMAALAEMKVTKEDIANAFHVPLPFLTTTTNLANLQAAEHQHMSKAISPRLKRRDEKINEQVVPLFDKSGRLFVASEDPIPLSEDAIITQRTQDLKFGIVTINEIRQMRGLDPAPWGEVPWLPLNWAPTNLGSREHYSPNEGHPDQGRNKPPPGKG